MSRANPFQCADCSARGQDLRGFTLLEVLVVIAIITVVAALVVPALADDSRFRLMAAAGIVSSDIEVAQAMSIANPKQPVIVRFGHDAASYWLAYEDSPETPIMRGQTGKPYRIVLGEERASSSKEVKILMEDVPERTLAFNSRGGLKHFTDEPSIQLVCRSNWIRFGIVPTTGRITEVTGSIQ